MMLRILSILVLAIVISNGQVFKSGSCPSIPAMTNFDPNRFSGTWYIIKQYPTIYETIARCPTIKYTYGTDRKFKIEQNQISLVNSTPMMWTGSGTFVEGPTVGKWTWNIPSIPIDIPRIPYQVLDTDYKNYAVVYSCKNLASNHMESLWIMSKNYPLFSYASASASGMQIMDKYGLNSTLVPAIQLLCAPSSS